MIDTEILHFIIDYYIEYVFFFLSVFCSLFLFHIQEKKRNEKYTIARKVYNLICSVLFSGLYVLLLKHNQFFSYIDYGPKPQCIPLFLAASIIVGGAIWAFLNAMYCCMRKILPTLKANKYGFCFLALGLAFFLIYKTHGLWGWSQIWYAADYSLGVSSRFLIGQILHFIFGNYVTANQANHFWEISVILLICLIAYVLNRICKKNESKSSIIAIGYLCIMYFVQPGSIQSMWNASQAGRLETYTLIIVLISFALFDRLSNYFKKYAVITLLCCIANAIYQGFVFLYYPAVLLMLSYDSFIRGNKDKKRKCLLAGNLLFTACSFAFFQFFSSVRYSNPAEFVKALSEHGEIAVGNSAAEEIVWYELFATPKEFYKLFMGFQSGTEYPREKTLMILILLSPVLCVLSGIYYKCFEYNHAKGRKRLLNRYTWCILLHFCVLPQFLLNVDWLRWMTALTFLSFFTILFLVYVEDDGMTYTIERFSLYLNKHKFLFILILVYLSALNVFGAREFPLEANALLERLQKIGLPFS